MNLVTGTGSLVGVLDVPRGIGPFPAVFILAGSGPTDRDGNQPGLKGDNLRQLGLELSARGYLVLRTDKRGVAGSLAAGAKEADLQFSMYVTDTVDWGETPPP